MRCADFGPTPGKQRSAAIKRSMSGLELISASAQA